MEVGNTKSPGAGGGPFRRRFKIAKGTPVLFTRWGEGLTASSGSSAGRIRKGVEPGVEEQRVLAIIDVTAPPEKWRALGDGYRLEAHFIIWEARTFSGPAGALFVPGRNGRCLPRERQGTPPQGGGHRRNGLTAEILSARGRGK
jgi:HlyD family secretion protein